MDSHHHGPSLAPPQEQYILTILQFQQPISKIYVRVRFRWMDGRPIHFHTQMTVGQNGGVILDLESGISPADVLAVSGQEITDMFYEFGKVICCKDDSVFDGPLSSGPGLGRYHLLSGDTNFEFEENGWNRWISSFGARDGDELIVVYVPGAIRAHEWRCDPQAARRLGVTLANPVSNGFRFPSGFAGIDPLP